MRFVASQAVLIFSMFSVRLMTPKTIKSGLVGTVAHRTAELGMAAGRGSHFCIHCIMTSDTNPFCIDMGVFDLHGGVGIVTGIAVSNREVLC